MGLEILKTGFSLPENIIENQYFETYLNTSGEWIEKRTGIKTRRISNKKDTKDLALNAIYNMNLLKKQIENIKVIIFTSLSQEYLMPSISSIIAGYLSIKNPLCIDLNMACSGFVGASILAEKYCKNKELALIVSAEVLSKYVDFKDRTSAVLFGDGAGAVLYEKNNQDFFYDCGTCYSEDLKLIRNSKFNKDTFIEMNGKNVYKFTMDNIPKSIIRTIEKSNFTEKEIHYFVLHQGNKRIIEGVAKRVGNIEKYYKNIENYGNTSSASIPICLGEMNNKKMLNNKNILISGFGGGFNFASCIVSSKGENLNEFK